MKSLHIGNIANMAFSYVDILRENQHEDDVLCYDLEHDFSNPKFASTKNPNPLWYKNIKISDYLQNLPPLNETYNDWLIALARDSRRLRKGFSFTPEEISPYTLYEQVIANNFLTPKYDLVFAYAYAAIPMMIHNEVPYVPIEIGTMRGIENKTDPFSRLIAYAYRTAPHVIITNPDTIISAQALNINTYTFIPHPINEDLWRKRSVVDRKFSIFREKSDFLIICPARHNWEIKGNYKYLKAFIRAVEAGVNAHLVLINWGEDVQKSRKMVKDAGIETFVTWLEPLSEEELVNLYSIADLLMDQFCIETFGLITPKAMACSLPVITSYNEEIHNECYATPPPLIVAKEEDEIFEKLIYYSKHKDKLKEIGLQSRLWIERHHSKSIIDKKFKDVKNLFTQKNKYFPLFDSLKQKKLEIIYEAEYAPIYDSKYHTPVPYQLMDKELVQIISNNLPNKSKKLRLLDLGCGPGSMVGHLMRCIPKLEIYGVDISPSMLKIARKKYPDVSFQEADAEDLPFEDGYFDVVLCSGMLHHFPALDPILLEIKRVLKENGIFVAREPNERNFANNLSSVSFAHICLRHIIFNLYNQQAIIEPEEHDFHRDFDYYNFPEEIGKYFKVRDLKFGQAITYFYDMITDPNSEPYLQELEETLRMFPGLNMVTVAVKSHECSVDEEVKKQQKYYEEFLITPPESCINAHLKALLEFYDWLKEEKGAIVEIEKVMPPKKVNKVYNKLLNIFIDGVNKICKKLLNKPIYTISKSLYYTLNGNKLQLHSVVYKKLHKKLKFDIKIQNIKYYTFDTDSQKEAFLKENVSSSDCIQLQMSGKVNSTDLIAIFNTVRDYTAIKVFLQKNLSITIDNESDANYFTHLYQVDHKIDSDYFSYYSSKADQEALELKESFIFSRFFLNDVNFFETIQSLQNIFHLSPDISSRVSSSLDQYATNQNKGVDFFNKNFMKIVVNKYKQN